MKIIPVVDLMHGQVVHAVAGQRDQYAPIKSRLCSGAAPADVGQAFAKLGLSALYVADLDAIGGGAVDQASLQALAQSNRHIIWDAGLSQADQIETRSRIAKAASADLVIASETLTDPETIDRIIDATEGQVTFSIDMKNGAPLVAFAPWRVKPPEWIAERVIERGVRRLIVLDLADVGTGRGVSTVPLVEQIRSADPSVGVIAGGGVRGMQDLRQLQKADCSGALVASAIHNGTIGKAEITAFADPD